MAAPCSAFPALLSLLALGQAETTAPFNMAAEAGSCKGWKNIVDTKRGEAKCEGRGLTEEQCKVPGCCTWDDACFFCGDLAHDPGCGGDGVGYKKVAGKYVPADLPEAMLTRVAAEEQASMKSTEEEDEIHGGAVKEAFQEEESIKST